MPNLGNWEPGPTSHVSFINVQMLLKYYYRLNILDNNLKFNRELINLLFVSTLKFLRESPKTPYCYLKAFSSGKQLLFYTIYMCIYSFQGRLDLSLLLTLLPYFI